MFDSVTGTWSKLDHWNSTLPVGISISWTIPITSWPAAEPPTDGEVGGHLSVDRDQRGVARRDQELVQVTREAVAGGDPRDLVVRVVVDVVPAAVAAEDVALVPGQHALATVLLHLEIHRGQGLAGQVPDELAVLVEDHRPVLSRHRRCPGDVVRREEHEAGARPVRGRRDRERRRGQIRAREERGARSWRDARNRGGAGTRRQSSGRHRTDEPAPCHLGRKARHRPRRFNHVRMFCKPAHSSGLPREPHPCL